MSRKIIVSQGFDFDRYGTATIEWTDSSGTYSASFTTGRYTHSDIGTALDHPSTTPLVTVAVTNPYAWFTDALDVAMNAAGSARTIGVGWDSYAGRYSLSVDSGTIAITWTGAAQVRMRNLLGFPGNLSAAASHTATLVPRFAIEPSIAYMTDWTDFVAQPDRVAVSQTDANDLVTLRPNLVPMRTAWEHRFEPVDQAHRWSQAVADSPLWTWSDMWMEGIGLGEWLFFSEAAQSPHPALLRRFAFQVSNADFTEAVVKPTRKDLRDYQTIRIDAILRGYA